MNEGTQTLDGLIPLDIRILQVHQEDVIIEEQIGCGQSGRVFKGILKRFINGIKMRRTIAIKEIRIKYSETLFDINTRIKNEVIKFKQIDHPNVLDPLGICEIQNKSTLVLMNYEIGGSLFNFLEDSNLEITREIFLNWSLQIVKGLEAIHSKDLLHCDLKAKNIMLSFYPRNQDQMSISVLKLSNISHFSSTGTATHMAPEAMRKRLFKASDIWSFGVVLWEILNRKKPFAGLEPLQVLYKVGMKKETLEIDSDVDPLISRLIKGCWTYNTIDRLDSRQIGDELQNIKINFHS